MTRRSLGQALGYEVNDIWEVVQLANPKTQPMRPLVAALQQLLLSSGTTTEQLLLGANWAAAQNSQTLMMIPSERPSGNTAPQPSAMPQSPAGPPRPTNPALSQLAQPPGMDPNAIFAAAIDYAQARRLNEDRMTGLEYAR